MSARVKVLYFPEESQASILVLRARCPLLIESKEGGKERERETDTKERETEQ